MDKGIDLDRVGLIQVTSRAYMSTTKEITVHEMHQ